jgi:cytochrome c553
MTTKARLRRLEEATERARENALADAAVRLLSDEDLLAFVAWMDTPEAKAGQQEPPHLTAAWKSACERAGIR